MNATLPTYSQDQLLDAFTALHDPSDWKAPIAQWVDTSFLSLACAAIMHYTATIPTVVQVEANTFKVTSRGYRLGPAGDK